MSSVLGFPSAQNFSIEAGKAQGIIQPAGQRKHHLDTASIQRKIPLDMFKINRGKILDYLHFFGTAILIFL